MHLSFFHEVTFTFYLGSQILICEVLWTAPRIRRRLGGSRCGPWAHMGASARCCGRSRRARCASRPVLSLSSLLILIFAQPGLPLELGGLAASQAVRVYNQSHGKFWKLTINRVRGEIWKTTSSFRHMSSHWLGYLRKRLRDPSKRILLPPDNVLKVWPLGTIWIKITCSVYGCVGGRVPKAQIANSKWIFSDCRSLPISGSENKLLSSKRFLLFSWENRMW